MTSSIYIYIFFLLYIYIYFNTRYYIYDKHVSPFVWFWSHNFVFKGIHRQGGIDHPIPRMRLSAAGQRTSVDGLPQIGGHYVLAFLQGTGTRENPKHWEKDA